MSRTFEDPFHKGDSVQVETRTDGGVHLLVRTSSSINGLVICVDKDTVPDLALTMMEKAGYTENENKRVGPKAHFALSMDHLRLGVEAQAKANAEDSAKKKALEELKSEALALSNKFHGTDWDFFPCSQTTEMNQWIQVAKMVRETAKMVRETK